MYSRKNPFLSRILQRERLSKPGSSRDTYHIVLEIDPSLAFKTGDSVAILPQNNPQIVDQILKKINATGLEEIEDPRTKQIYLFRDFLLEKANLHKVSLHKLFPVEKSAAPLLDLVDALRPSPSELCSVLLPLMPRFYSIASSYRAFPNEIHLTVALASFVHNGRTHFGAGSDFLCQQASILSTPIPIYIQSSHHFTLPESHEAPMIMIGPGTGIAPFRAFLQERLKMHSQGKNWLFFGERNRATDFYYEEFFKRLETQGKIELDVAFSRDQPEKIYVQHKMLEQKEKLWQWIQEGAYLYVCGDANKMAKDVENTLVQIGVEEGKMSWEESRLFLKSLRLERKYLLDVY